MEALKEEGSQSPGTPKSVISEEESDVWRMVQDPHVSAMWTDGKACLWDQVEEVNTCRAIVPYVGHDGFEFAQPSAAVPLTARAEPSSPMVYRKRSRAEFAESECRSSVSPNKGRCHAKSIYPEDETPDLDFSDEEDEDLKGPPKSPRERVLAALKTFKKLKQRLSDAYAVSIGKYMRLKGMWLNRGTQYIGHVPGVEYGDTFTFRVELLIVGLHLSSQGGIAAVKGSENKWGVPVANSIVISGGYYDNQVENNSFIYIGSGDRQKDQKLTRGNLALANSYKLQVPVRVIKAVDGAVKAYRYDGLYLVTQFWEDTNDLGFGVFKYRMQPCNGQPVVISKQKHAQALKKLAKLG